VSGGGEEVGDGIMELSTLGGRGSGEGESSRSESGYVDFRMSFGP
jgi:hypothetical protein